MSEVVCKVSNQRIFDDHCSWLGRLVEGGHDYIDSILKQYFNVTQCRK